jgi:hypothetical protein
MARWIFGLRIFGAWIAGMVHMPWRVFFLWNAAGGITWCVSVIGLGYFFGHSLHAIEQVLGVGGVIAVLSVAVVGFVMWRRFEKAKLHEFDEDGSGERPHAQAGLECRLQDSEDPREHVVGDGPLHDAVVADVGGHESRALCDALSAP